MGTEKSNGGGYWKTQVQFLKCFKVKSEKAFLPMCLRVKNIRPVVEAAMPKEAKGPQSNVGVDTHAFGFISQVFLTLDVS